MACGLGTATESSLAICGGGNLLLLTEDSAVTTAGGLLGTTAWGATTVPVGLTAGGIDEDGGWGLGKGKSGISQILAWWS